jgi:hypothetical protein
LAWLEPVAPHLVLGLRRGRIPFAFGLAGVFYVSALLPNVLVTHYSLHSLHFIALHAFLGIGLAAAVR